MIIRKLEQFEIDDNIEFINEILLQKNNRFKPSKLYTKNNTLFSHFFYKNELNENIKVIVGSVLIDSKDVYLKNNTTRNLNNILFKNTETIFNILIVDFQEYDYFDEKYTDKNSKDNKFIFKKLNTIMYIIKKMSIYNNCKYILIKPAINDIDSGKIRTYNKRDRLYRIYLDYFKYSYQYYNYQFEIKDKNFDLINDLENFYIVKIT